MRAADTGVHEKEMSKSVLRTLSFGLLLALCAVGAAAQDTPPTPTETPAGAPAGPGARPGGTPSTDPQPYEKVITKDAKTREGIFKVHKVKDK